MSWIKDMFGTKAKKQQAVAEMRRYANNIVANVFRQTFNNYSHASPVYDLQNPVQVLEESILSNTDVLGVVSKIYGMAQNATLRLYQRDENGKLIAYDGENKGYYNRFLTKPSRQMDFDEFLQQYFNFICTIGNSFWSIVRYKNGELKGMASELVALYPQYVNVVTSGDYIYPISGYEYYWNPNKMDMLNYDDVVHIKWANPKYVYGGQFFGLSPMKVAQKIVQKQNNIVNTENAQIGKGGPQKAAYIESEDDGSIASQLQQEEFKDSMEAYVKAARGDTPLLSQKIGVVDLQASTKDLGLVESSQDGLRAICRVLSFPSQLLNDNSASTYNNVSEARKSAWTDCIIRHLSVFEKKFTEAIITEKDKANGVCYKWDYSSIPELSEDLNKTVDALIKAKATPNELRQRVGLKVIDDEAMNVPYFAMNETPLGDMGISDGINEPAS